MKIETIIFNIAHNADYLRDDAGLSAGSQSDMDEKTKQIYSDAVDLLWKAERILKDTILREGE